MKDKKAAKTLLKRAKEHPDWYTEQDVYYAKQIKRIAENNGVEAGIFCLLIFFVPCCSFICNLTISNID